MSRTVFPPSEGGRDIVKKGKTMDDLGGMTNLQYKGMLLDQLADWKTVLKLAKDGKTEEVIEKAEEMMERITEKMKF